MFCLNNFQTIKIPKILLLIKKKNTKAKQAHRPKQTVLFIDKSDLYPMEGYCAK
jgi:type I restriction-modification system DNA methylase subunit